MEKSHVGMGYDVCPVCCTEHSETVLIDRRLKKSLQRRQATGWAMCPACQAKKDEGYIALVICTNQPSSLNDANRTGEVAHVRASAWPGIFNTPVPPKGMGFAGQEVLEILRKLNEGAEHD